MAETPAMGCLQGGAAEAAARRLLESEGLPYPVVPEAMVAGLQQITPTLYSSCEDIKSLWNVDGLLGEAVSGKLRDGVAFGFEGHGIASWAFHYLLVDASLVVVLQLRWGGAFSNVEKAKGRIAGSLDFVRMLREDLSSAATAGKLTADRRVAVLETDFSRSRWAWVEGGMEPSWDPEPPVMFNALMSVRDLLESS